MARTEASDFLHGFRFHVRTETGQGQYSDSEGGEAGFQSCSLPETSVDPVEYRDGLSTYTRKYPGIPTISEVSLMRGVTKKDTSFHDWIETAIRGGSYRSNMTIFQWHRDGKTFGQISDLNKARKYLCYECFPVRSKPAADMDATSSEVSMMEVDIALEWYEIEEAT